MKKLLTLIVTGLCYLPICSQSFGQTNTFPSTGSAGIGTTSPDISSLLEIKSTTQGLLIPRMTKVRRDAITTPATGLMIYQTNTTPGFYYYDGSAWKPISTKGANTALSNLSSTAINANLKPKTTNSLDIGNVDSAWRNLYLRGGVFIGGKQIIRSINDINDNIFLGDNTGILNTLGKENITLGNTSLNQNTTGSYNVAIGKSALFFDTASNNIAIGSRALFNNLSGFQNIAVGYEALYSNTSGINNSAFGYKSLHNNSGTGFNGLYNSAFGSMSLSSNTTGSYNSAFGTGVMYSNLNGSENTAMGYSALQANTSGIQNISIGNLSLNDNTTGNYNTAIGYKAFYTNTAQEKNTAVGWSAGDGFQSAACTYLGFNAHATVVVNGSMALGINAVVTASNQVRVGTSAITSIGGFVGWSNISDGRVKKNIKQNVPGLAFINKLNPVTYNLNIDAIDNVLQTPQIKDASGKTLKSSVEELVARKEKEQIVYTGFVAQEVEKAAKQIGYDFSGVDAAKNDKDLYGLRYSEFVVPLVKAVQELSKANDALQSQINMQQKQIDDLKALIVNSNQSSSSLKTSTKLSGAVLQQNVPNPFNSTTNINYSLPQKFSKAQILITNESGKQLKQFYLSEQSGTLTIDASSFSSGVYYYSLYIDGKQYQTKKMSLIH